MEFLLYFLIMLWPPFTYRTVKEAIFGPRSPGWGGAIEAIVAPFHVAMGIAAVAVWISLISGVIFLIQHLSVSFH